MSTALTLSIQQSVAVLVDGNNVEMSIHSEAGTDRAMCNYDHLVARLVGPRRALNRFFYFREGKSISAKFAERMHNNFYGVVVPCRKNADIRLTIEAVQLASKVDCIIIVSGDSDYIELVQHLKSNGIRVEVAGVRATTSAALISEADFFHEITSEDWFRLK